MYYLDQYRNMLTQKGFAQNTIKTYCTYIRAYLQYVTNQLHKDPASLSWEEKREFIYYLQSTRNLSNRSINSCISQLRFFTLYVLHQSWDPYELPFKKYDSYIPYIPTRSEALQFISSIPDIKQKAMISLLYSGGLRVSEVCHLRYEDIDASAMRIYVSKTKNRSPRQTILSHTSLSYIKDYWFSYNRPKDWLFPKQTDSTRPIDTFYVMRHIKEHESRLHLPHKLTAHSFRHAFGTHLYENGTDLYTIQKLMGHKSISSTFIYIRLANTDFHGIQSPLDNQ